MPFRFNMLLEEAGISPADVRLLRHQPKVGGRSFIDIWRTDRAAFEEYQTYQAVAKRAFFASPYWATFIGSWDGRTLFTGLYSASDPETLAEAYTTPLTGNVDQPGEADRYRTGHMDILEVYEGRLYIDWGGGSSGKRAWVQRADQQNKIVTELHLDAVERPFPGLMNFAGPLSHLDDAPSIWQQTLTMSRGVYLLTCPRDGSLYVGSATAEGGFWQRWAEYRANGHGGNVALIGRDPSDFTVSILEVAGSAATSDDILAVEQIWKRKLSSRGFGLNRN